MQHIELDYSDPVHEGFFDAIQELLGAEANPNFHLQRVNSTTVKLVAGTDNDQVALAINGKYRWRTNETTAALPGGLPNGEHPIFVTASDNDFGGPLGDPDEKTDYTFGLQIKKAGETPATALYRIVGYVTVASGAITGLRQVVNKVTGAQIEEGALSNNGDLSWTRESSGAWVPQIKTEAIGTGDLGALVVTALKLANEAVETGKIANLAVTEAKLANEGVATGKIANLAVTAAKIALEAVGTGQIANLAVTVAKLANEAVETAKIKDLAVTEPKLGDGAATSRKMKPTMGSVNASGTLNIKGGWQEVPGAVIELEPPVESKVMVWGRAWVTVTAPGGGGGGVQVAIGPNEEYATQFTEERRGHPLSARLYTIPANEKTVIKMYGQAFGAGAEGVVKASGFTGLAWVVYAA